METCFPWAARRPIFKWFVRDALLNTSLLLFFLFSNQWPHCILGGQLLFELFTTTSFHPQSKFISCYDITVELQRLEELYAGRETEEKLRSK